MPKRLFEFECEENHHITERLVVTECREATCSVCGNLAKRIVSSPQVKLEGITGAFPGAYDAWERKRAEKQKQEQKRFESRGEHSW